MNDAQVSLSSWLAGAAFAARQMTSDASFFAELSSAIRTEIAHIFTAARPLPLFAALTVLCRGRAWLSQCGSTPDFATPSDKGEAVLRIITSEGRAQTKRLFRRTEDLPAALSAALFYIDAVVSALAPISDFLTNLSDMPGLSAKKLNVRNALKVELVSIVGCKARQNALGKAVCEAVERALFNPCPEASQKVASLAALLQEVSDPAPLPRAQNTLTDESHQGFWLEAVELPVLQVVKFYLQVCPFRRVHDCLVLHKRVQTVLSPLTAFSTRLRGFVGNLCFNVLLNGRSTNFVRELFPGVSFLDARRFESYAEALHAAGELYSDSKRSAIFQKLLCDEVEVFLSAAKAQGLEVELAAATFLKQLFQRTTDDHLGQLLRRHLSRHFEPKTRALVTRMLTSRTGTQFHTALFLAATCFGSFFVKNALNEVLRRLLIYHPNWNQLNDFVAALQLKFAPQSVARLIKLLQEQATNSRAFPIVKSEAGCTTYRYLLSPLFRRFFVRDEPIAAMLRLPPPISSAFAAFQDAHAAVADQLGAELREARRPDIECLQELSTAQVVLAFSARRVKAVMSLPQLCVLQLFNERDALSVKDLLQETGLPITSMKAILERFVEFEILVEEADDVFLFNDDCRQHSGLICLIRTEELLTQV